MIVMNVMTYSMGFGGFALHSYGLLAAGCSKKKTYFSLSNENN